MAPKLGVISLGCSKNRIDTELMLGLLQENGYEFVQEMEEADIALINTCAFTNEAKEEAINIILEAEQQKKFGHLKGIIVTGCLPQRYKDELNQLLPRVDSFLGVAGYKDILDAIEKTQNHEQFTQYTTIDLQDDFSRRILTTVKPTAYVKIADGCDNHCNYCVIPQIRGAFQSRKMESVLDEIKGLAADGYSEIILVAQDTTKYGEDIYGMPKLAELMDKAAGIPGVKWLRVLYSYPNGVSDELLDVMAKHNNIVKYLDIPIQHMDNDVLRTMNRRNTYELTMSVLERIRRKSPDFVVRSTVIVGFPGESRESMQLMRRRLEEAAFDHLGIFSYSQEEGTFAAEMAGQIDDMEKEFRRDDLHNHQSQISFAANQKRIGKVLDVLIEGKDTQSKMYYGRAYIHAPEVDGKVFVETKQQLVVGKYYPVKITKAHHYDLVGKLEDPS